MLLARAHHIEVCVEGRDLVDLRHGDLELLGQRLQVSLRQASLLVLDEMEIFDQQRALPRTVGENRTNGSHLLLSEHPAARKRRGLAATGAWMDGAAPSPARAVALGNVIHALVS